MGLLERFMNIINKLMKKTQEELVNSFADSMLYELIANEHKGDWRDWKDPLEIQDELHYHLGKLNTAIYDKNTNLIKEHLADCGNLLLMLGNAYDLY